MAKSSLYSLTDDPKVIPDTLKIILDYGMCDTTVTFSNSMFETDIPLPDLPSGEYDTTPPAPALFPVGATDVTWKVTGPASGDEQFFTQTVMVYFPRCGTDSLGQTAGMYYAEIDGDRYSTVRVGCNCWLAENMRNTHYADGDTIMPTTFYNNDPAFLTKYGRLYSYEAAVRPDADGRPSTRPYGHVQGICPKGWAIPSKEEFEQLIVDAGSAGHLKSNSPEYWLGGYGGVTPNSGFNGIPAGYYDNSIRSWCNQLGLGRFWTSDVAENPSEAVCAELCYYCPEMLFKNSSKTMGYSVRCIKKNNPVTITANGATFEMVLVKAGLFEIGHTPEQADYYSLNGNPLYSDYYSHEKPGHPVRITQDYYIGEYEVTQELWMAVMKYFDPNAVNPSYHQELPENDPLYLKYPVERLANNYAAHYDSIQTFISRLNKLTGRKFALPTDAQWEVAARGGVNSAHYSNHDIPCFVFSGSDSIDEVAWYEGNSKTDTVRYIETPGDPAKRLFTKGTHPVGQKKPNELGLYDMSGNVAERTADLWGYYNEDAEVVDVDPTKPFTIAPGNNRYKRTARSGHVYADKRGCRVAWRRNGFDARAGKPWNSQSPYGGKYYGFRLMMYR